MTDNLFYGTGLPYLKLNKKHLSGKLIVIEGADCSGRSTQIALLKEYLEASGHGVLDTGLRRSGLVGEAIEEAKGGNTLGKTTLSLMYATDFADQLENKIIPALKAGFIVLADRYIFTLMVRDLVRGADKEWLQELFSFALVPDKIFYMNVDPETLLHRALLKYGQLDYWESGMDVCLSSDMFESFTKYQSQLKDEYATLSLEYGFDVIDGSRTVDEIQKYIRDRVDELLESKKAAPKAKAKKAN
ncbi:dTMP kinase [Methanocella sp. CWC-04]|uniref:Probable thymidylate kinase n=1 Tax=Methanooceanicella nereidis TaxID=2052831 RepID=A0AAP2RA98_9EURY|nr:dTMP kinase [Methanocella sp. CWC-04]MCD1293618.1 dTMP kinase [Methanocella sp. CWC-04]